MYRPSIHRSAAQLLLGISLLSGGLVNEAPGAVKDAPPASAQQGTADRFTREGVTVEFSATPVSPSTELTEGEYAEISFKVTDATTGRPLRSLTPGAWMDIGQPVAGREGQPTLDCREKVGLYLSGRVGIRPLIDLNSYYVLALNRDSSISVVDPMVGMAGRTYLYAHIALPRPGADWAKTADDKRLYVTIPRGGQVAVVDTESFKTIGSVSVGGQPVRIVLQGDGRYLWVGNDAAGAESGVVVVDRAKAAVVARIPTGQGHHEIVLSPDDRFAFVGNQEDGTVSVIDVQRLAKTKDVKTGGRPVSLAYSRQSQALYVADSAGGVIAVVDGRRHDVAARVAAKPGLQELGFTEDGRWALVANPAQNAVYVVDASANRLVHTVPVGGGPYQLTFTKTFAYVRALDSERVAMIPLSELGRDKAPPVNYFQAGEAGPGSAGQGFAVAGTMTPALGEAAMMVANPADGNIYFYMEGMVAPMATFRNYAHRPAALILVNRSLRERELGVYSTTVRIPSAGTYDVALLLDSPRVIHCFAATAKASLTLPRTGPSLDVEFLVKDRRVPVGRPLTVSFKLTDAASQKPRTGLTDVRVLYYMAPAGQRREATAREVGDGIYEASLSLPERGAYYVYVAVPSAKVKFGDLTFLSLVAQATPNPAEKLTGK